MKEGVDQYAYFQLVLSNVPSGGLEGVIGFPVVISPSGASKKSLFIFDTLFAWFCNKYVAF